MKDQFVIACVDSPLSTPTVIAWARHFAERLRHKGLMLLNVSRDGQAQWLEQYGLPYVALKGDWATAISGLPTAFSGILAVAAVDPSAPSSSITHPKTLLKAFRACKTAYLTVPIGLQPHPLALSALTLTHQRESKEKLIWASYLARFLDTKLTFALPQYRDSGLKQHQFNNIKFADKTFSSLGITYQTSKIPASADDLYTARTLRPDLIIALTTDPREWTPFDLFTKKVEQRLLTDGGTPVIFLNPRDDLYVLCD